jgi:TRAP-type C4-dicarboxylate transport system substrate-binding protein
MGFNPSGGKIANATDVAIGAHATVGDGQALSYNSADQLWENRVGATTFNVRNYGALGNTKQVIGSINSGSHTLTITQSVFTSGYHYDIGLHLLYRSHLGCRSNHNRQQSRYH